MHVAKATSSSAKSSSKISNNRGKNENKYVNAIQEFQSENDVTGQNNNSKSNKSLCTNVPGGRAPVNCSKTILVNLAHKSDPSVFLRVYAIIDEHSNCTLIDPKVIDLLNLKSELHNYSVNTVGGCDL